MVMSTFLLYLTFGTSQILTFNIQVPTCPTECICLSPTQVMCNTGGLTEIPLNAIPSTVEYLSLTKNAFTVIKSDAFKGLRNIRKLSLDGNNITMIKPFAFRGLPKLRELSIQHTPLTTISQFSFAGLQNITSILLGHNKIEKIEGYAFAGTSNVRLLLLNSNPVQKVEARAFSGLRNVDHLIFPSGVKNLEADAFSELDYVGILKLAFMDLAYLKPHTFRGLSHVQLLAITDSDLGVIRANAFEGMTHIGSLNLINNKIDAIQQFHIKKVNNVRVIRLHGNHLLETPHRNAIIIQNVETLSVNKNHFPCDCHLHTLLSSPLVNSSVDFRQNNYCISPLEVNGKPISHIDVESLGRCQDEIARGSLDALQNDSTSSGKLPGRSIKRAKLLVLTPKKLEDFGLAKTTIERCKFIPDFPPKPGQSLLRVKKLLMIKRLVESISNDSWDRSEGLSATPNFCTFPFKLQLAVNPIYTLLNIQSDYKEISIILSPLADKLYSRA